MKFIWNLFWRELEFKRQVAHLLFGLAYSATFALGWMTPEISFVLVVVALGASQFVKRRRTFVDKIILLLERQQQLLDLPLKGLIFFLLGASLTIWIFEPTAALAGLLVLSITDSLGTLYGKYLGVAKIRWNPNKHMEGPILGGLAAWLALMSFLPFPPALLAAYLGAFIDTLPLKIGRFELDDNLIIPLAAAALVQVMT